MLGLDCGARCVRSALCSVARGERVSVTQSGFSWAAAGRAYRMGTEDSGSCSPCLKPLPAAEQTIATAAHCLDRHHPLNQTLPHTVLPSPRIFMRPQLVDHLAEDMAREAIEGRTITLKLKLSNFEVGAALYPCTPG